MIPNTINKHMLRLHNQAVPFLRAWVANPREIGAILPSSDALARAMASEIPTNKGVTIEVGAGTGAITGAIVKAGIRAENLFVIEQSPVFSENLRRDYPGIRVITGDAAKFRSLIKENACEEPRTVVSSLPLLSIPLRKRLRILSEISAALQPGGRLIQFTYGLLPPIPTSLALSLGLSGQRKGWILSNIPPAAVWIYQKQSICPGE